MTEERQHALVDVRIAVRQEDAILMLQRSDELFPGYWTLPGGHARPGEDAISAAGRELREETGLAAAPEALEFAAVSHLRSPGRSEKISFTFLCLHWTGTATIREPAKFSALAWTPIAHPPASAMPQASEALRMIRSGQRFSAHGPDG